MNNSLVVVVLASGVLYGTPLLYAALGELLAEHVRLEERELFPAIEATLNPEQLSSMASALAIAERDC